MDAIFFPLMHRRLTTLAFSFLYGEKGPQIRFLFCHFRNLFHKRYSSRFFAYDAFNAFFFFEVSTFL